MSFKIENQVEFYRGESGQDVQESSKISGCHDGYLQLVRYVMSMSSMYSTMCSIDLPRISWTVRKSSAQRSQSKVSISSSSSMSCLDLFQIVQYLFLYPHHFEGYVKDEWDHYSVKFFASTDSSGQQGDQGSFGVQGGLDFSSPLEEMSA